VGAVTATCPFCAPVPGRVGTANEHAVSVADGYPVTPGHRLVVPRRHVASVFDLTAAERQGVWDLVAVVREEVLALPGVLGVNIGVNDGPAAGQTVPHAHVHVIPRRPGDVPDPRGGVRWVVPDRAAYWDRKGP
jgi:diadenosine tetraphosphate (Ap4A) HIT family hydrolase